MWKIFYVHESVSVHTAIWIPPDPIHDLMTFIDTTGHSRVKNTHKTISQCHHHIYIHVEYFIKCSHWQKIITSGRAGDVNFCKGIQECQLPPFQVKSLICKLYLHIRKKRPIHAQIAYLLSLAKSSLPYSALRFTYIQMCDDHVENTVSSIHNSLHIS